ncbi:MAG: exo-alpha-sialidase [Algicola sp.]|nr:exo-alpha-sialidase [Algicola sp.]
MPTNLADLSQAQLTTAHAPTLCKLPDRHILLVFFGREPQQNKSALWQCTFDNNQWQSLKGVGNTTNDQHNYHNPVLYQCSEPGNNQTWLFSKIGGGPSNWRGVMQCCNDNSATFTDPLPLPKQAIGPTRNPPMLLDDGSLLIPSSSEKNFSGVVVLESIGKDDQYNVEPLGQLKNKPSGIISIIQPAIARISVTHLRLWCRSNTGFLFASDSFDGGQTFDSLYQTEIVNPNSAIAVFNDANQYYLACNPSKTSRKALWVIKYSNNEPPKVIAKFSDNNHALAYPALQRLDQQTLLLVFSVNQQYLDSRLIEAPLLT